jgi:hypothetical protein
MIKYINKIGTILIMAAVCMGCSLTDQPVDEDGLLITDRAECFVSNFELLGLTSRPSELRIR